MLIIGAGIVFIGNYSFQKETEAGTETITKEESKNENEKDVETDNNIETDAESESLSYSVEPTYLVITKEDGSKQIFDHDRSFAKMDPIDYSPTRAKVLLTPQYGWEEGGALYVYSKENGLKEIIDSRARFGDQHYPSGALWLDERYIIYISSYLYGTIPSGDIQIYDTEKERTEALELFKGDAVMQLTRVTNVENPYIVMSGIKFTDEMFNDSEAYIENHDIETILKMIE
ncbi:hypothetical protein [Niallia circulans]|uniref:Uncharacterized protein n=1 Tax=Niallia circulans TaxID=1397 RepID=A0A941JNE8_NIACI|nr:hypothetical protein [Niallia circulans]MCB5237795.1 hypothetical protein [Niallia circulans]